MEYKRLRFLEKALRRMFREVGQKYYPRGCGQTGMVCAHTWTIGQERMYEAWFAAQAAKDLGWDRR